MAIAALINFIQGAIDPPPGRAIEADVGAAITCSNAVDTDVTGWSWLLLDVPRGENSDEDSGLSANIVLSTNPTLVFTPDVPGTYRVQLQVTDGSTTKTIVGSAIVADEFGIVKPGFQSVANELDLGLARNRGWADLEDRKQSIQRKLCHIGLTRRELFSAVSGSRETALTGFETVGAVIFDPQNFPSGGAADVVRSIKFEALISATAGMTAQVRLFNVTGGAAVPGTTFSTTNLTPTIVRSAALVVPTDLPNAEKVYEVQLRISAGSPGVGDRALCQLGHLKVEWA